VILDCSFDNSEHPLVGQLGGNNPEHIATAAKMLADRGYDEINLNCGCPSNLVSVTFCLYCHR
jgi:tRNA-dihydrouridine synthase A